MAKGSDALLSRLKADLRGVLNADLPELQYPVRKAVFQYDKARHSASTRRGCSDTTSAFRSMESILKNCD